MKKAEELLKEKGVTPETMCHNSDYVFRAVYDVIEQAQKEAYNQALEDACNHDKVDVYYDENVGYCSTRQSILKLKK